MNIMITGCAGFIGSHATELFLKNNHTIVGYDALTYAGDMTNMDDFFSHKNFTFIKGDICDTENVVEIVRKHNIEWIINFAAETHVDNSISSDDNFVHSNILGTKSLLNVCRETKSKLFHISTDEVYGSISEGKFDENSKLEPRNPYSATKAAAEHFITSYSNTHGVEYIIVRPSNNFGPRQHGEKFLPTIIRSLRSNKRIPIYGNGKNVRDWLYVGDNVQIIYNIWKTSPVNEIYNISLSNEKTNLEIVKNILSISGKTFEENVSFVKDRAGHDFRYSISNKKMLSLVMKIDTNFSKNLLRTIESIK